MGDEAKRDVHRFEPPPWEREAFEALARRKAEEKQALEALAAAEAAVSAPAVSPAEVLAAEVIAARRAAETPAADAAPGDPAASATADASDAAAVDDRQVQVMLMELGREETTPAGNVRLIARIAPIVTGLIGAGMLLGGISALQKASGTSVGMMGSAALSVFGLCFFGMAAWVWVRSNHVKGSR